MNKYHLEILEEIKKAPKHPAGNFKGKPFDLNKYLGSPHKFYYLNSPTMQQMAKGWAKQHENIFAAELSVFLTDLFKSESTEEKMIASYILEYLPKQRQQFDLTLVDQWLNYLMGWVEIDTLGTGPFRKEDILDHWSEWAKWVQKWAKDKNINKRRFALVVLIISLRDDSSQKLADLAFKNISQLKSEKDVLITKAISWVLRSMIKNYQDQVENYLKQNESILPNIVVREVSKKLLTGKK